MTTTLTRGDGQSVSEINMTPLIDVMLVLLIIFIITIPIQTNAIKIDNPRAAQKSLAAPAQVIDLSIDFDGTIFWNRQRVTRSALRTRISHSASMSPRPEVRIAADKFAKYEVVAQTLADLQQHGLKQIAFVGNGLNN